MSVRDPYEILSRDVAGLPTHFECIYFVHFVWKIGQDRAGVLRTSLQGLGGENEMRPVLMAYEFLSYLVPNSVYMGHWTALGLQNTMEQVISFVGLN